MDQLPFLEEVILGALWASSITALGIFVYTLLLISFKHSVIYRELKLIKKWQHALKTFKSKRLPLSQPMQQLLQKLGKDWEPQYAAYLTTTNEGIPVIASVLRPVAPLLGLAGTLMGISSSLAFVSTEPELVIQGFSYAINTTLIGIFISVLAHVTAAWIWGPYWKQQKYELYQTLCMLHTAIIQERNAKKIANQKTREFELLMRSPTTTQLRRNGNHVGTH
jgi:biopolymer transport protein ExbB/TolQ